VSTDRSAVVKDACDRARAALRNGEVARALRYFEYAQRLAPSDAEVTLAIGAARLSLQDARATESFTLVATRDDVQEAWLAARRTELTIPHCDSNAAPRIGGWATALTVPRPATTQKVECTMNDSRHP
jgi:hypothetical protein